MEISDQTLIAYLDGELTDAERMALEAALAGDASLAARLQAHRALADQVRAAFAGVMDEPAPERLTAAVGVRQIGGDIVVAFPAPRPAPTRLWGGGAAIAASLAVGVLVGHAFLPQTSGGTGLISADMNARGVLSQALDRQLASTQISPRASVVKIGISFRSKAGPVCRTFQTGALAGLACRQDVGWRVRIAVPASASALASDGGYSTAASSIPPEVMALAGSTIDGRPFDAAAEAHAKAGGWR